MNYFIQNHLLKLYCLVFFLVLTPTVYSQKIDTLKMLLNKGNLKEFNNYRNKIHAYGGAIQDRQNQDYEIVDSFSVISFEYDDMSKTGNGPVYVYTFDLLTYGNSIIYCKVEDRSNDNYTNLLKQDTDKAKITLLQNDYMKTYGIHVNISSFFGKDFVYGAGCGFVGRDPDVRKTLNIYVASGSTNMLDKWLLSPTIEIQMYALDGFNQLVEKGYKLTPDEQRFIDIIENKKGYVNTCGGCMYSNESIYEIMDRFTFINHNRKIVKQDVEQDNDQPVFSISGIVTYKNTHLPAKGDSVKMFSSDGSIEYSVTDGSGKYSFDSTKIKPVTSYIIYGTHTQYVLDDSSKVTITTVGNNESKKFIRNLVIPKK